MTSTRAGARLATSCAIAFCTIGCIAMRPSDAEGGLLTGLVGHWAFDGNGTDSSGNGRDLTIQGGAGFAPGKFGQALQLDGTVAEFATRPGDDAAFNFGPGNFTWVKFNAIAGEQTLIENSLAGKDPDGRSRLRMAGQFISFTQISVRLSWIRTSPPPRVSGMTS